MYRLSDAQYEFIKEEVVNLFEHQNVNCIPINGFELAYKLGIRIIPYSALSVKQKEACMMASPDGIFLETKSEERIYLNDEKASENFARINMTILHEIAHDVLGHSGKKEYAEREESEANFFAKYASAPPPLVHRLLLPSPHSIQKAFCISTSASQNAYNYYLKWLRYGKSKNHPYEIKLLQLFPVIA